jgi:hypothetical protein
VTGLIGAVADLITTALTIVAMGVGALILLCWTVFGVIFAIAFAQLRRKRKRGIGDDVIAEFGHDLDAEIEQLLGGGDGRG